MQSTRCLTHVQRLDVWLQLDVKRPLQRLCAAISIMSLCLHLSACDSEDRPRVAEAAAGESAGGVEMGGAPSTPVNMLPQAIFEPSDPLPETPLATVPFPHDLYRDAEQKLALAGFPNQSGVLAQLIDEIEGGTSGFGTTSGLFLAFQSQINLDDLPSDGGDSLRDDATVALIDIDPNSPELGRRWPIYWKYTAEETSYLPAHTLRVRLLEGIALRPLTTYALIVTQDLASPSESFSSLLGEQAPDDAKLNTLWSMYEPLRAWLTSRGDSAPQLAVASVFTTQDPITELFKLRDFVHTLPPPEARELESLGVQRAVNNYEVFVGRYTAPRFQSGDIPYKTAGGGIEFVSGLPQIQGEEDLRFSLAVPEGDMPQGGWPIVLYAHGTGGNYQSYYRGDIGLSLAKKGLAVISIDQIHHGDRDGGLCDGGVDYSQCVSLLFFNFLVPKAGRDNVRQSAIDYVSLMRMVQGLEIPADVSDLGVASRFNPNKIMFMGHSQGGLNGPLFMAIEPQIIGGVLSGAGSNIAISLEQKTRPFDVNQLVRVALGLNVNDTLDRWHPALSILQMFIEPGDSSNFANYWFHSPPEGYQPKSVLMTVGLRDEYTPPESTFALAVAGRVPLIQPVAQPIAALDFLGITDAGIPPISANVTSGDATAGLAQYEREGHFVIFDLPSAKERYSRFLQELAQRPPPSIY